jgi:hypothetical protein
MIALGMFQKSKGGRGKKADIPYARGSFTLPPELKQYLDAQAEKHQVSMSEMLARILQEHQEMTARPQTPQPAVIPEGESTTPTVGGTSTARTAPKKKEPAQSKQADSKPEQLRVLTATIERSVRGKLRWDKEKYARAEELLAEGSVLTRQATGADWVTEKGSVVSWRTVEALLKHGICV